MQEGFNMTNKPKSDKFNYGFLWPYVKNCIKVIGILACLYLFICSLDVLSTAFKLLAGQATGKC